MAVKKKSSSSILEWLDDPLKKGIAILTGLATIFGLGFKAGDFKKDLESKLELIKAQQECNRQVEAEKSNCAELRQKIESKKIEELTNVVEELKKTKGGKNEK